MLIDTLKKENLVALKEKDNSKRAILSVVINKYMVLGYEAKAKGNELTDDDLIKIITKTLKELEEEKEGYKEANNKDQVKNIDAQINTLKVYLPKMLTEVEIKKIILKLDDKLIPNVMKYFKTNYGSKCDMGLVNKVLKSL